MDIEEIEKQEELMIFHSKIKNFDLTVRELANYLRVKEKIERDGLILDNLEENVKLATEHMKLMRDTDPLRQLSLKANKIVFPKCPDCGQTLSLLAVNIPQGRKNLHGYKSRFQCQKCFYEEFSMEDYLVLHKKFAEKRKPIIQKLLREQSSAPKVMTCECGATLVLSKIKEKKGRRNRNGYKSVLTCLSCGKQTFSGNSYNKAARLIGKEIDKEYLEKLKG